MGSMTLYKRPAASAPRPRRYRTKKAFKDSRLTTRKDVKRILSANIERKWYQNNQSSIVIDSNGTLFQLNPLNGQGPDAGQRIGYEIRHKSIDIMYRVVSGTAATSAIRVIMFWYRSTALATPTISDILVAADLGGTESTMAKYSYQNQGSYQVIYDRVHTLASGSANLIYTGSAPAVGGSTLTIKRVRKPLKDKIGEYESTAGSTMSKGALYMMMLSDVSSVGGTNRPTFAARWTLSYTDA